MCSLYCLEPGLCGSIYVALSFPLVLVFVLVIVVIKHFEIGLVDIDLYIDFAVFCVFGQYFVNNFSYEIAINIIIADSFFSSMRQIWQYIICSVERSLVHQQF